MAGRRCQVCTSKDRQAIEKALVGGQSARSLASEYRISDDAISRHRNLHLPERLAQAETAVERTRADILLELAEKRLGEANRLQKAAESQGDMKAVAALFRAGTEVHKLLLQCHGALQAEHSTTNVTVNFNLQVAELKAVVVTTLERFPEAQAALSAALERFE